MSKLRNGLAGFGLFTVAVMGSSAAANATTVSYGDVSYDDVGFGNLSGYNPFNILDGQTAGLRVGLTWDKACNCQPGPGPVDILITTNSVVESLNGLPFTLTQRGSKVDLAASTGYHQVSFLAGFTFNLGVASYIQYVPSTPGQIWTWTKGAPTLSHDVVTPGEQVGPANLSHFASLPAGKYTLLLSGVGDSAQGPTTFGGEISAVPLPGSLIMFGSAMVGVIAFGTRRRSGLSL